MAGLGDLIVVVEDLATYQAALDQGKTAPSVMYLILKERQIIFNSELWSKAPEEGGGGGGGDTEELEEVAAAGLVDLKAVQLKHDSELSRCTRNADFNNKVGEIDKNIIDNEELTAYALIDIRRELQRLKDRIIQLEK